MKFFATKDNQNVIQVISGNGNNFTCENCEMVELKANMSDGAGEKHIPVVEQNGDAISVLVGSVGHPMTEEHSINWVLLETKKGLQLVNLLPQDEPAAHFTVSKGDTPIAAYAYCNLHGFWKTDIK